jgi:glycosyltransferase 2 family protein
VRLALRFGLSAALIGVLFTHVVDWRELLRILGELRLEWLLLALAVVTFDRVLMTYKWTLLLRAQGHELPLTNAVMIYCASLVWGVALPATVGADAIRAVMVARRGISGTDVVTSIVLERMIGFVLALTLGIVSLSILRAADILGPTYDKALYAGFAVLLGSLALLAASMSPKLGAAALRLLPDGVRRNKVMQHLTSFTRAYQALGSARRTLVRFAGLTVFEQLFGVVLPWTLAMGLGIPVDVLVLLGVLPISTLISRLPISLDGLGVFEAVFVGLMMLAGIAAESAFAIAIAGRFIQLLAFLPWWLAYVAGSGKVRPPPPLETAARADPRAAP